MRSPIIELILEQLDSLSDEEGGSTWARKILKRNLRELKKELTRLYEIEAEHEKTNSL